MTTVLGPALGLGSPAGAEGHAGGAGGQAGREGCSASWRGMLFPETASGHTSGRFLRLPFTTLSNLQVPDRLDRLGEWEEGIRGAESYPWTKETRRTACLGLKAFIGTGLSLWP